MGRVLYTRETRDLHHKQDTAWRRARPDYHKLDKTFLLEKLTLRKRLIASCFTKNPRNDRFLLRETKKQLLVFSTRFSGTETGREYGTTGNNGTNGNLFVFPSVPLFPFVPYSLLHLFGCGLRPRCASSCDFVERFSLTLFLCHHVSQTQDVCANGLHVFRLERGFEGRHTSFRQCAIEHDLLILVKNCRG